MLKGKTNKCHGIVDKWFDGLKHFKALTNKIQSG
jgi:hypothetical protein